MRPCRAHHRHENEAVPVSTPEARLSRISARAAFVQGVQLGRSWEAGDDVLPKQLELSGFVSERPDEDPSCAGFDECRHSLGAQCRGADQQRGRSQLVDRAVQHRGQHIGEHPVSLAGVVRKLL
jgi:hypothetical protein